MEKLIDVLTAAGLRTGEVLPRGEIHRLGKIHRAVHVYLFNSRNELLLQRRSMTVDNFPGGFSVSVVGHIDAGEFSGQTARREVEEELGIDTANMQFDFVLSHYQEATLSETYIDRQFNDVYVTRADIDPALIAFDRAEVAEVLFMPYAQFRELTLNDAYFAAIYGNEARDLDYFLKF